MTKRSWQYFMWMGKGAAWLYSTAHAAAKEAELKRLAEEAARPPDPMDGLADAGELDQYRYQPGAFYLGQLHEDHGANFEAGIHDDRGVFMVAGSGAGKGTSFYIQNCLRWPGPLVCVDPKGEAAMITAMRRGTEEAAKGTGTSVRPPFLGQRVAILDPFGLVKGPARRYRVTYNPLRDVDLSRGGGVRQIRAIASGLVVHEPGEGKHFSESAETLIAGVIEVMKLTETNAADATLPKVRRVVLGEVKTRFKHESADAQESKEAYDHLVDYLKRTKTKAGLGREALAIVEDVGRDEWSGYRSTLSRAVRWMAEPEMQDHLQDSSFSLWDIVQEGGSVYFVLQSDEIDDYKSWLRVVIRMATAAKMALGTNQKGPKTLFMLDEFAALGRFRILEKAVAEMRGYGIKLVPVIQNIGQLKELYGANWETFLANSAAILAWGLNDGETEKYIADRFGRVMSWETSAGVNAGGAGFSTSAGSSANSSWRERPVRFPNEIHEQGAAGTMRAFVIPAAGKGFTVRRRPYYEQLASKRVFDSPDFIAAWEEKYGGKIS
jgi:type IV secretion system protein VirD4